MIYYDPHRWYGLAVIIQREGSVLPKCLPPALLAAVICAVMKGGFEMDSDAMRDEMGQTYAHQVLVLILAYLLVVRSNLAFARWWEARNYLTIFFSKMGDVLYQAKVFSVQDEVSHARFGRRMQHLHLLLVSCVLQEICREDDESNIVGSVASDIDDFQGDVILAGEAFAEERRILANSPNRPLIVMSWITETWVNRQLEPSQDLSGNSVPTGIRVHGALLARAYQQMSEIMYSINQLYKIAAVPVPFPYCQMSVVMLGLFAVSFPYVAATLIPMSFWAVLTSFLVTLGFYALDAIASELGEPFGTDENDLPLQELMAQFRSEVTFMRVDQVNAKTPVEILLPQSPFPGMGAYPGSPVSPLMAGAVSPLSAGLMGAVSPLSAGLIRAVSPAGAEGIKIQVQGPDSVPMMTQGGAAASTNRRASTDLHFTMGKRHTTCGDVLSNMMIEVPPPEDDRDNPI